MFLHNLVELGGITLNHSWHGINMLSVLECALLATVLCALLAIFFGWRRKNNRLAAIAVALALSFATAAYAANTALSNLTASGALAGTNLIYVVQTAGTGGVKATFTQVLTFIMSQISGDVTCASGGACTVGKIGGVTPPSPIGTVTSVASACGVAGGTITTTGTLQAAVTSRSVTGATDTILAGDCGNIVYYNSASAIAVTQPAPSGSFAAGFFTTICNINAGTATVTPGSGTIGGAGTFPLLAGTAAKPLCSTYQSDGTNFNLAPAYGTRTIANGTSALATGSISSATCATVVTTSAPNVATTDTLSGSFNSDPTGVTGYTPSASGMLTIIGYPTANNVNWKVCNNTASPITPGAITLNWIVTR